jgi:hypothetical protein
MGELVSPFAVLRAPGSPQQRQLSARSPSQDGLRSGFACGITRLSACLREPKSSRTSESRGLDFCGIEKSNVKDERTGWLARLVRKHEA